MPKFYNIFAIINKKISHQLIRQNPRLYTIFICKCLTFFEKSILIRYVEYFYKEERGLHERIYAHKTRQQRVYR